MLGLLRLEHGARGRGEMDELYGLRVLRAGADPEGLWGRRRLLRAGRALRRGGVVRTLAPAGFDEWDLLEGCGLLPVDPGGFLRAQAVPLALGLLLRRDVDPGRATVALRGARVDRDMRRAAAELCRRVRRLSVDAPGGGAELAKWLRWEFGIPVLPPGEEAQAVLRFHPAGAGEEGRTVELYGPRPDLAGLTLSAPALREGDREDLPLLAALWEGGRLDGEELKIS